jgi:CRISPR/Cas system CMR-associated protein Cmr5 small subunit
MQNLDQIRAQNALNASLTAGEATGVNDGDVIKKVPSMVQQNGLLGAIAFALDGKEGHEKVLQGAVKHYKTLFDDAPDSDLETFAAWLCKQDSARLRAVTAEILAYLNYYRHFASAKKKEEKQNADRK